MPVPLLPHTRTALAANQPLIIVALGSSSTRGWMATDIAHSYPALLQRELNAAFPKGVFAVINRGIGGQDAPEELARLDADVLVIHPQLVIWQVGANGAVRDASPDVFKRLVAEGIDKIKAAGADVIMMDNQRSPRVLASPEHKIIEAAMSELAADAGVNLFSRGTLMDSWAAAGAPYDDFVAPDGLHMNDRGYTCMARALADSIIAALRQPIAQQPAPGDCDTLRVKPGEESKSSFLKKEGNCPGMEMASTEGKQQGKRFFFEKKNQKTFTSSG